MEFTSQSKIFLTFIATSSALGKVAKNLDLCIALSVHACHDTGHPFFKFPPKDPVTLSLNAKCLAKEVTTCFQTRPGFETQPPTNEAGNQPTKPL